MFHASDIASIAAEYDELRWTLQSMARADRDLPDELLEREAHLVRRLIAAPASSGPELAHKARVLLDWVLPEDLPGQLTTSLCHDAIRVFLRNARP